MSITLGASSITGVSAIAGTSSAGLNVDGSGYVTFPSRVCFYAYRSDDGSSTTTTNSAIPFNNVNINRGSGYNTSTGRFTVPAGAGGIYEFCGSLLFRSNGVTGNGEWYFALNGSNIGTRGFVYVVNPSSNGHTPCFSTVMLSLSAGDVVDMRCNVISASTDYYFGGGLGHFQGKLIG